MRKEVTGNLLELPKNGEFQVIVHGCNCFCKMGAGIAKQIREEFPFAWMADCETEIGDKSKLGDYTYTYIREFGQAFVVVNAYTQYNPGKDVSYDAIADCFAKIAGDFSGMTIGYPAIGCGIAGGQWGIVKEIIDHHLEKEDHTFVKFG